MKMSGEPYETSPGITITNGFTANLLVVAVRTGGPGSGGVSLVVLETENQAGFRVGRRLEKLGQHACDTAELFFDGVAWALTICWAGKRVWGFAS